VLAEKRMENWLYQVAIKYKKVDLPGIIPSKLSKIQKLIFESNLVLQRFPTGV